MIVVTTCYADGFAAAIREAEITRHVTSVPILGERLACPPATGTLTAAVACRDLPPNNDTKM